MFAAEGARACSACRELTPHRRERVSLRSVAFVVLAALIGFGLRSALACWVLVPVALVGCALDPGWRERCVRCVTRAKCERRRLRPGLRSERFFLF